ncbi:BEN domain-containing protein 6-like isoform X2 [Pseudorasbora parva]|uniref:BEN domain-containing protein 6-like isoform X2 n=1 Tax=Pseudorasbora parva TaxID=51549 RepID=UPI00351DE593
MAFAIYYFKDKSVEVGKIDWMSTEDQKNCSKIITQCPTLEEEDGWMSVKWEKGRKKKNCPALFPAKVLMFGDNYRDLCQKREQFIKGEDIWKQTLRRKTKPNSWLMEDVEEEENEQPKKQSTIENESSSDEDILARNWSKVQQQMKELKRENKRLKEDFKQILDAMRELPTQLKEVIGQITVTAPHASTSATASTSVDSASVSPQVLSDDMVFLMPGCNVKVPKRKLNSLWMANPSVYTGDLAALVYGRETLSHSSLTGRQSGAHKDVESKPQLDSTKLDAIFDHALSKFPDITMQDVRRIIRKKCNNESYIKQATAKKAI